MEVVHHFNNELSSLYDVKPPISKAKMTAITKAAIKGIKLYKHVVQSVEKFIQKCRPEYKVPGLYVVDSIVRQSRHQFGSDRDVFGPRFARNITNTFQHLFKCPEDEKAKIVRVLNLWQKNNVFDIEVIQPLLDMANPNAQPAAHSPPPPKAPEPPKNYADASWNAWNQQPAEPFPASQVTTNHEMQEQARQPPNPASIDPQLLIQLQQHLAASTAATSTISGVVTSENTSTTDTGVKFNKKLLDFDYGDEEEEEEKKEEQTSTETPANALALSVALIKNPDLFRQLSQMNLQLAPPESAIPPPSTNEYSVPPHSPDKAMPFPGEAPQVETSLYSSATSVTIDTSVPPPFIPALPPEEASYPLPPPVRMDIPAPAFGLPLPQAEESTEDDSYLAHPPPDFPPQDLDERVIPSDIPLEPVEEKEHERSRSPHSSSRHRSRRNRSRSPRFKGRRSRSDSRQRSRRRHSRSRSRDREREKERERERERERKHRGLLPIKKNHLGVYSTTLWLGHLSKLASEADLSDAFGEYGTITKIDVIPPRGCAFICMSRRQDALRALHKLRDLKLHGITIKMAWAPGKGVKEKEYKDYWDVEMGVSHIPWERLSPDIDLDAFEEGGMIDEDSAPDFIREKMQRRNEPVKIPQVEEFQQQLPEQQQSLQQNAHMIAPPPHHHMGPVGPPPVVPGPMPVMTMPPFGVHLPGMIPPPQPVMMSMPMGVPPPNPMMMGVHTQQLLGSMLPPLPPLSASAPVFPPTMPIMSKTSPDATPTEEEAFPSSNQGPPPYLPPLYPPSSLATGGNSSQGPPPSFPPPFPPPPNSLSSNAPSTFSIHYPPPSTITTMSGNSHANNEMTWMGKGEESSSSKSISYPPLVPPPFIPKGPQPPAISSSSEFIDGNKHKSYNNNVEANAFGSMDENDTSHYMGNDYYKNYSNNKGRFSRFDHSNYEDSSYNEMNTSSQDETKHSSVNNEPYPFPEDYMEDTNRNESKHLDGISPSPSKSRPLLPDPIQDEKSIPVVDSSTLRDMLPKEFGRKDNLRDMLPKEFGRKDNFRDAFPKEFGRKDNYRDSLPKEFGRRDKFNRNDSYRDNYPKRDNYRDRQDNFRDRRDNFSSGIPEREESFPSENTFSEHPVEKEPHDFPPAQENFNIEGNFEEFPSQPPDNYNPENNFPGGNKFHDFPPPPRDHFDTGNNYQDYPQRRDNFEDFPPSNNYQNFPPHPPPGRENFPPMGPRHPMDNYHHPMGPHNNFPDYPPPHPQHMMDNFPPPDFFPRPRGRGGPFRGGPRFFPPPGGPRFPPRGNPDFHPRGGPWMRGAPPRFRGRGGGFRGRRNDWDRPNRWPQREGGQEFQSHHESHSSMDDDHEITENTDTKDDSRNQEFAHQQHYDNMEGGPLQNSDKDLSENKEINSPKNDFNTNYNSNSEEQAMDTNQTFPSESDETSHNQTSLSNRRPPFVPPPARDEEGAFESNISSKEFSPRNPRRKSRWSNKPDDVTAINDIQENFDDAKTKDFNADYPFKEQESIMEASSGQEVVAESEPHPSNEPTTANVES